MFQTLNGDSLKQWKQGQKITEPTMSAGDKVVFVNSSGMTIPMRAYNYGNSVVVDVPNKMVTTTDPFVVYINGRSETRCRLKMAHQAKPVDYMYIDNDDWPSDRSGNIVVDLAKFKSTNGYTFNDLLLSLCQTSIQNGGTVEKMDADDVDGALCKAMSTDSQVICTMSLGSGYDVQTIRCPMTMSLDMSTNRVGITSAYALLSLGDGVFECRLKMSFYRTYDKVNVAVKATPFE